MGGRREERERYGRGKGGKGKREEREKAGGREDFLERNSVMLAIPVSPAADRDVLISVSSVHSLKLIDRVSPHSITVPLELHALPCRTYPHQHSL